MQISEASEGLFFLGVGGRRRSRRRRLQRRQKMGRLHLLPLPLARGGVERRVRRLVKAGWRAAVAVDFRRAGMQIRAAQTKRSALTAAGGNVASRRLAVGV